MKKNKKKQKIILEKKRKNMQGIEKKQKKTFRE